jgi:caa(3)-type oxidase subunit IV
MAEPIRPVRTYLLVFAALLALTVALVLLSFVDLGASGPVLVLAIAGLQAALILTFFSHARAATGITRLVIGGGLFWLAILIVGTLDDLLTRGWLPVPGK